MDITISRSYLMLFLVFIQNIHTFNCRSEKKSLFKIPFKNNYIIYLGIGLTLTIQLLVSYLSHLLHLEALHPSTIIIDLICALPVILVMEIFKLINKKNID